MINEQANKSWSYIFYDFQFVNRNSKVFYFVDFSHWFNNVDGTELVYHTFQFVFWIKDEGVDLSPSMDRYTLHWFGAQVLRGEVNWLKILPNTFAQNIYALWWQIALIFIFKQDVHILKSFKLFHFDLVIFRMAPLLKGN